MRYELPSLPYGYAELEPHISEEQLKIHHQKHHKAYVDGANSILDKLDKARKEGSEIEMKSALKALTFNIGGHKMHSLFWENLSPDPKEPKGSLLEMIDGDLGGFARFEKEFSDCALTVEGSGWAVLTFDPEIGKLIIGQIEKHGNNVYASLPILMVMDMFEHAYYLDRKNDKAEYFRNCWQAIDWEVVENRLLSLSR